MTSRLVLHLSGAWTKHQDKLLEDGDILCRMPGLSHVSQNGHWQELPRSPQGDLQALLDQYMGLFERIKDQLPSLPFTGLINDQFIYSVIPVAAALTEIASIIESRRPSQIVLFHATAPAQHIPATGIVTIESSYGSRDVLGTLVAASVRAGISEVPVESHKLRGDPLSRTRIRRAALRIASSLILLRFVFRMLRTTLSLHARQSREGIRGVALVRSAEHARHAARIFSDTQGVCALVTPQFTQGNSETIQSNLEGNLPWCVPGAWSLVRSLLVALSPTRCLQQERVQRITCGPFSFTASLTELERDNNAVRFYAFQNSLLRLSLRAFPSARFTAGFEVQGVFAWIEGCVPRAAGMATRTIQPVLVQKRPLPVFPFSDQYLADSSPNRSDLADIGAVRFGVVDFQGPPFEVRSVKKPRQSMVLGFFTQPYEIENNVGIAQILCEIAKAHGWTVVLRLHPRDDVGQFNTVMRDYPEVCSIPDPEPLESFLDAIDVSVTRTSSVTKEAIARGCPCVCVLLSDLDRTINADYIRVADRFLAHVVKNLDQMAALICDPAQLNEASVQLQDRLIEGRSFHEFVEFVSQ